MIAILESDIKKICAMRRALETANLARQMVYFETATAMLQWLDNNITKVRLISFGSTPATPWYQNGELIQPGTGLDVIKGLEQYQPNCTALVHSEDKRNNANMGVELACQGINSIGVQRKEKDWIEKEWLPQVIHGLELSSPPFLSNTANLKLRICETLKYEPMHTTKVGRHER